MCQECPRHITENVCFSTFISVEKFLYILLLLYSWSPKLDIYIYIYIYIYKRNFYIPMKGFKVLVFSPFINNISNLLGDVFLETS